jgi:hypothetical protein
MFCTRGKPRRDRMRPATQRQHRPIVRVLRCHPVTEEYDAVLAGLQRRGFRLELSADDESVVRVTSPGGNTLDHPSLAELRHLLRGISILSLTHQRDHAT